MRTGLSAGLALGLLLALGHGVRADDQANAVIDKAIEAHGGEATLAKLKAETWKTKGAMAGGKMAYTADYAFMAPDRFRFIMNADFGGNKIQLLVITDGKQAWERSGFTLSEMQKPKLDGFKHQVYTMWLCSLAPLKDKEFKLASLGESKRGNQEVVGVKVSRPGQRDVTLFFDKQTGLLAGNESRVLDEFSGFKKEVSHEVFVSDYKVLDGRKYFTKIVIKQDGKVLIEEELSDQKSLEKLDDKLFTEPKGGTR